MKWDLKSLKQERQLFKEISSPSVPQTSTPSHKYPSLPIDPSLSKESCSSPHPIPLVVSECVGNQTATYPSSIKSEFLSDTTSPPPVSNFQKFNIPLEINQKSSEPSANSSDIFISPANQWIIQNMLNGIDEVDDQKVVIVAVLTCSTYDDIIRYLLQHGWNLSLATTGIRYVRGTGKEVLSKNWNSQCAR